jgi:hypothetical protein
MLHEPEWQNVESRLDPCSHRSPVLSWPRTRRKRGDVRFRRRPPLPRGGVADRLREANGRLYGWTVRGDGIPLSRLIDEAADEIDAHIAKSERLLEALRQIVERKGATGPGAALPHEIARQALDAEDPA